MKLQIVVEKHFHNVKELFDYNADSTNAFAVPSYPELKATG
jgi:hypothetical protein